MNPAESATMFSGRARSTWSGTRRGSADDALAATAVYASAEPFILRLFAGGIFNAEQRARLAPRLELVGFRMQDNDKKGRETWRFRMAEMGIFPRQPRDRERVLT